MLSSNELIQLHKQMLRIRMIEEKIAVLYPEQEMRCPIHLCIGQEAIPVGVCAHLQKSDYVLSNHRSHGHYLAKGGNLRAMLAELFGKETGCCQGKGGSMHLMDLAAGFLASTPIVASTIPIAVGAALAIKMKKEKRIVVVFFGEAATEEGVFHEALNFAVLKDLPVVFICENNLYSVYSPLSVRQPKNRNLFDMVKAYGIDVRQGDGNKIEEVHRLAEKAVQHTRARRGPSFLIFETYRWLEHCGPNYDNHIGYRTESEFLEWKERCPLKYSREQLLAKRICSQTELDQFASQINLEIEEAVKFAKESPLPKEGRLFQDIYAS